jgi:hypothetical protein
MHWRSSPSPARRPPGFIEPCLPTLAHAVPTSTLWAYEIKHDGLVIWAIGQMGLWSVLEKIQAAASEFHSRDLARLDLMMENSRKDSDRLSN